MGIVHSMFMCGETISTNDLIRDLQEPCHSWIFSESEIRKKAGIAIDMEFDNRDFQVKNGDGGTVVNASNFSLSDYNKYLDEQLEMIQEKDATAPKVNRQ